MPDWDTYYKQHSTRPPRELLVEAMSFCMNKDAALDLGAGTFIESAYMIYNGFNHVLAVDSSKQTEKFLERFDPKTISLEIKRFDALRIPPNAFDLVNAQYALPFYGKEGFGKFVSDIKESLRPGGVFVGQFFGVRDEWNVPGSKLAFHSGDEIVNLLSGLTIRKLTEEEKDGKTAKGEAKHWHVFHFIAVK